MPVERGDGVGRMPALTVSPTPLRDLVPSVTAQIVSAYIARNAVENEALPALVRAVGSTLAMLAATAAKAAESQPAGPAEKSICPDWVICLEDGVKRRTLRRHVRTVNGITLEQYREKWNLPDDHPMVAPNYTKKRSALAKELGAGRWPRVARVPGGPRRWSRPD